MSVHMTVELLLLKVVANLSEFVQASCFLSAAVGTTNADGAANADAFAVPNPINMSLGDDEEYANMERFQ